MCLLYVAPRHSDVIAEFNQSQYVTLFVDGAINNQLVLLYRVCSDMDVDFVQSGKWYECGLCTECEVIWV